MRKYVKYFAIILASTFLSGCSQIQQVFEPKNIQKDTEIVFKKDALMDKGPVRGGTLRLFSTYPDTLNPILTSNIYVREMLGNVYESLVTLDVHMNPIPKLAEKWVVSEDLSIWTFTLKRNILWQDNIPFTAEDVEFSVDAVLNNGQSSYRKNLENIAAFAALDKYTFRISLKTPNAFTAEMMNFPILPKHYYVGEDFNNSQKNFKPLGTGPYKFVSYEPKKTVKLIMNDKWWGAKTIQKDSIELPYIAELQYNLYEMGKDSINAFQASDIDVSGITNINALKYMGRQDLSMRKYPNKDFDFLAFNLSKNALDVKAVRHAIAFAIDRNVIVKDILVGQGTISDIPMLPSTWLNDTNNKNYEYDLEKAKKLLVDDGWKQTQYGLYRYINGNYAQLTFEMLVNDDNESRIRVAQYIADQLSQIGIQVTIKKVDFNTYQNLIATKKFDLAIIGCHVPTTPDMSFLYASWNNKAKGIYCFNVAGFNNSSMDNFLGQVMTTKGSLEDGARLKQIYSNIKDLAMEELPYLGLYINNDSMLYNKKVRGDINPSVYEKYNDITRWYLP